MMLASVGWQTGWLAAAPQPGGGGGLGGNLLSSGFIAAGVMMLVWLLLRGQWRRQREHKTPLEHMDSISAAARDRGREELISADLVQLSRRVLAQIEARTAQLEALLADADDRIRELRSLQADAGAGAGPGGADGSASVANGRGPARASSTGDPVTRGVYELADRGLAPVEIARELDQHLGAVELILALRPK